MGVFFYSSINTKLGMTWYHRKVSGYSIDPLQRVLNTNNPFHTFSQQTVLHSCWLAIAVMLSITYSMGSVTMTMSQDAIGAGFRGIRQQSLTSDLNGVQDFFHLKAYSSDGNLYSAHSRCWYTQKKEPPIHLLDGDELHSPVLPSCHLVGRKDKVG
jgi:hypothetical protein